MKHVKQICRSQRIQKDTDFTSRRKTGSAFLGWRHQSPIFHLFRSPVRISLKACVLFITTDGQFPTLGSFEGPDRGK